MKKTTILWMLCILLPIAMEAKKKPFGNGLYWEVTKQGELIISGKGDMPDFAEPHYKKYETKGTAPWNQKKVWDKVNTIIVEEGITKIGAHSFNGKTYCYKDKNRATHVKEIKMPSTVKEISKYAFAHSFISTFQFPSSVVLGYGIFDGCFNIHEFTIPSNWVRITSGLFYGCRGLSKVNIHEGVTEIGAGAFRGCTALQKIALPNSVKKIEKEAFYNTGLRTIAMGDNIEYIGNQAFYNCKMASLKFPKSLKVIGYGAFSSCDNLTHVTLPDKVETIGEMAFAYCDNLLLLFMSDGVKSIGARAFDRCPLLMSVRISQNAVVDKNILGGYSSSKRFSGDIYSLPPNITESNCYSDYGIEKEAFQRYKNGENGIINSQGKLILEMKSGRKAKQKIDEFDNSIYYEITDGDGHGILRDDGQWIVPVVSGRKVVRQHKTQNSPIFYEITDKTGKGIINANGQWIISTDKGYNSITELKSEDVVYYIVSKNTYSGPYGLLNSRGNVIIPLEYSVLQSAGGNYLRYKIGDFYGIMNYQGNVIIPTTKGYTLIGDYISNQNSFTYATYNYKGEVDANGNVLSKIEVVKPQPAVAKKETTTTTSSSNTSKTNNTSGSSTQRSGTQTVVVEHHRDPIPMQEWQACFACGGMGTMGCDFCGGSGTKYIGDRLHRCSRCNGGGIIPCNVCFGNKGQYITVYR